MFSSRNFMVAGLMWLIIGVRIYFWALYSVPWTHESVFVPVPCCFDDCSFVVLSEAWVGYASSFVLFSSRLLWQFWVFSASINFRIICCSSLKNVMGSLIGITLNQLIALASMAILTILILPKVCKLLSHYPGPWWCWEEPEGLGQDLWEWVSLSLVVARTEL